MPPHLPSPVIWPPINAESFNAPKPNTQAHDRFYKPPHNKGDGQLWSTEHFFSTRQPTSTQRQSHNQVSRAATFQHNAALNAPHTSYSRLQFDRGRLLSKGLNLEPFTCFTRRSLSNHRVLLSKALLLRAVGHALSLLIPSIMDQSQQATAAGSRTHKTKRVLCNAVAMSAWIRRVNNGQPKRRARTGNPARIKKKASACCVWRDVSPCLEKTKDGVPGNHNQPTASMSVAWEHFLRMPITEKGIRMNTLHKITGAEVISRACHIKFRVQSHTNNLRA